MRPQRRLGLRQRVALVRISFGLIWLVDAALKFRSPFINGFQARIVGAGDGQPGWLRPWFEFWAGITGSQPHLLAYLTLAIEALIAMGLLIGFARRIGYLFAFCYSLALWAIPEGFGGPYSHASTDMNAGLIYAVVFAALYGLDTLTIKPAWAIDNLLTGHWHPWQTIAEPATGIIGAPANRSRSHDQVGLSYAGSWLEEGENSLASGRISLDADRLALTGSNQTGRSDRHLPYTEIADVERSRTTTDTIHSQATVKLTLTNGRTLLLATMHLTDLGELAQRLVAARTTAT